MITEAVISKQNDPQIVDQHLRATAWSLTQNAFDSLLRHLHPNREVAGEIYEESRRKLVRYFMARDVDLPDCLADQTMDRAIRRFEAGAVIPDFQHFCFGIARLLHLETLRKRKRERTALNQLTWISSSTTTESDSADESLECLERLVNELPENERRLILAYYQSNSGKSLENRKRLAAELGIAPNAVRIRVHRIRRKLESRFLAEEFDGWQRVRSRKTVRGRQRKVRIRTRLNSRPVQMFAQQM